MFVHVKGGRQNRRVQPAFRVVQRDGQVQVAGRHLRVQVRGRGLADPVGHAVLDEHAARWPTEVQRQREKNTHGLHHRRGRRALAPDVQTRLADPVVTLDAPCREHPTENNS